MARARTLKPGYFGNDVLADCTPLARILFSGLWCFADREGRLEYRAKKIKASILPFDECDIDKLVQELIDRRFVVAYRIGEDLFLQVVNFGKHQNPHMKEPESTIPAPDSPGAEIVPAVPSSLTLNPIPLTLNPLTPIPGKARPRRVDEDTPEFLSFWAHYPEKIGKAAARRAFATALPKTTLDAMLASLERYKASKPPDRSWCHPATWLNQERWLDQPASTAEVVAHPGLGRAWA